MGIGYVALRVDIVPPAFPSHLPVESRTRGLSSHADTTADATASTRVIPTH